jgi:hypothetical protein
MSLNIYQYTLARLAISLRWKHLLTEFLQSHCHLVPPCWCLLKPSCLGPKHYFAMQNTVCKEQPFIILTPCDTHYLYECYIWVLWKPLSYPGPSGIQFRPWGQLSWLRYLLAFINGSTMLTQYPISEHANAVTLQTTVIPLWSSYY